ncbi:MAG TPA: ATP-binding protein, partial [Polyangiaceae bacterium]|nr:ATP-binding protein [Polyangiaceae bacterium]
LNAGKLRLEVGPLRLDAIVGAALETVRPAADAKGIRLEASFDDAGELEGDDDRLQQVASNLLSNAVKFTGEGGRVAVRLSRQGARVELRVADTGAGIAPELVPRLFDPFRHDGKAGRGEAKGGLGLGLSIVKSLVELHGGTVRAESEGPGRGATFVVELPSPPPPAAGAPRPVARAPSPSGSLRRITPVAGFGDATPDAGVRYALAHGAKPAAPPTTGPRIAPAPPAVTAVPPGPRPEAPDARSTPGPRPEAPDARSTPGPRPEAPDARATPGPRPEAPNARSTPDVDRPAPPPGPDTSARSPSAGSAAPEPSAPSGRPKDAEPPPSRPSKRMLARRQQLEGARMLVVDDDPDTRYFITSMLRACGAEVTTADSAHEAFYLFQRTPPDVLVSDISMPDEDGCSLVRSIRRLSPDAGGRTPAVALSALDRPDDRSR